jgi:hypothetical protein
MSIKTSGLNRIAKNMLAKQFYSEMNDILYILIFWHISKNTLHCSLNTCHRYIVFKRHIPMHYEIISVISELFSLSIALFSSSHDFETRNGHTIECYCWCCVNVPNCSRFHLHIRWKDVSYFLFNRKYPFNEYEDGRIFPIFYSTGNILPSSYSLKGYFLLNIFTEVYNFKILILTNIYIKLFRNRKRCFEMLSLLKLKLQGQDFFKELSR